MNQELCQRFDDYLSGLLNDQEHDAFAMHLHGCAACQELESQVKAIEESIRKHNDSLHMRSQRHAVIEAKLREAMQEMQLVGEQLVETRKARRDWRPVAALVLAALAASVFLTIHFQNKPDDDVPIETNTTALANLPIDSAKTDPPQDLPAMPVRAMSVRASPGFLSARVESEERDIEYYVVLPSTRTPSSSAN